LIPRGKSSIFRPRLDFYRLNPPTCGFFRSVSDTNAGRMWARYDSTRGRAENVIKSDDRELIAALERDEGIRLKPYLDTVGKLTIGIGRNLDDVGISPREARYLLSNDLDVALKAAKRFRWFGELDDERQRVIVNMVLNLGAEGFMQFRRMIAALSDHDYELAAAEAEDSKWFRQVGPRGERIVDTLRTGEAT